MIQMLINSATQRADLVRSGGNFVDNELLDTAVAISLFTRRRALPGDVLPVENGDRGGWWADCLAEVDGDLIGSRLWLLSRSKLNQATLNLAREYSIEALAWMVDDGVAGAVDAIAERFNAPLAARYGAASDAMLITTHIAKPKSPAARWTSVWWAHLEQL